VLRTRWLPLALLTASVASLTSPGCESQYDCTDAGRNTLYQKRIAPLLAEERPSSCSQCHLAGVDLGLWVKDTPCQTMACMQQSGIVDLETPENSLILQWIGRAAPESNLITEQVIAEEREGMLEWIRESSACGPCWDGAVDPCTGKVPSPEDCGVSEDDPQSYGFEDPGDCSDRTLEALFLNSFFPHRMRCFPCHFDGQVNDPEFPAPKWIGVGDCAVASLTTFRRVTERGYIDVNAPEQSLWLLKPLDPALGGVEHGGGPKIHAKDEPTYVEMLRFATRWANCNGGGQ
jgi:hypothetical protein